MCCCKAFGFSSVPGFTEREQASPAGDGLLDFSFLSETENTCFLPRGIAKYQKVCTAFPVDTVFWQTTQISLPRKIWWVSFSAYFLEKAASCNTDETPLPTQQFGFKPPFLSDCSCTLQSPLGRHTGMATGRKAASSLPKDSRITHTLKPLHLAQQKANPQDTALNSHSAKWTVQLEMKQNIEHGS